MAKEIKIYGDPRDISPLSQERLNKIKKDIELQIKELRKDIEEIDMMCERAKRYG